MVPRTAHGYECVQGFYQVPIFLSTTYPAPPDNLVQVSTSNLVVFFTRGPWFQVVESEVLLWAAA